MKQQSSMTGFARAAGELQRQGGPPVAWTWELRSVNGRGLDLRLKLPTGFDAIEPRLRAATAARFARGSIQASLTLSRDDTATVTIDRALIVRLLGELRDLGAELAHAPGNPAEAPPRLETLLALPGVIRRASGDELPDEPLMQTALAGFETVLNSLARARAAEGGRLREILSGLLDRIAELQRQANVEAMAQPERARDRMTELLSRLLGDAAPAVPADRLAQEVAILATRSDVTEELDRLASHITAARALLETGGAIGRQLDFLVQEFMREANTLCSKSATTGLTAAGLQLKATIEQVREQVQNIE
jgi:uncharacterized protein (TIGR00255 family)